MDKSNWKAAVNDAVGPEHEIFGANFKALTSVESYYPTRYEYFLGKIITGLVTGRSEKDTRVAVRNAMRLADELEVALNDKAQD